MIDLAGFMYRNVREEYNDSKLLEGIKNKKLDSIARLMFLYDIIDIYPDTDVRKENYPKDVSEWIDGIKTAEHYLQRIEFYHWYLESLFYLVNFNSILNKEMKIIDVTSFSKLTERYEYLCLKEIPPSICNNHTREIHHIITGIPLSEYIIAEELDLLDGDLNPRFYYALDEYDKLSRQAINSEGYNRKYDRVREIKESWERITSSRFISN